MKNFTLLRGLFFSRALTAKIVAIGLMAGCSTNSWSQATLNPSLPANKKICTGANATFSVSATAAGTITYQWQESVDGGTTWNDLVENSTTGVNPANGIYTGTASPTLTITRAPSTMNGNKYRSNVFVNGGNKVTSIQAVLNVGPDISLDDASVTNCPGTAGTLNAAGTAGVTYQWQVSTNGGSSWTNVIDGPDPSGATYSGGAAASLVISPLTVSNDGYRYRYTANDGQGCVITSGVTTQQVPALAEFTLPASGLVSGGIGSSVSISATVTAGTGPFKYQWYVAVGAGAFTPISTSNAAYSGATGSTLTINSVTNATYTNRFRVIIKNGGNCSSASSAFTTIGIPTVLSNMIQSFNAERQAGSAVNLSWAVNPALDIQTYTVERSTDGEHFTEAGTVKAEAGKTSYTLIDVAGGAAIRYRLKMADPDQAISYSKIISIAARNVAELIELRPTYTTGGSTILYTSLPAAETIKVTVMDVAGRVQWSQPAKLAKGETYTSLDISRLVKGIYYVRVSSNNGISRTLTLLKN